MNKGRPMRAEFIVLITLAAFGATSAVGADSTDAIQETLHTAAVRNVPSLRPGSQKPSQAGKSQVHAVLRQRMLGLMHRPARTTPGPARSAVSTRVGIHTNAGPGGSRQGAYHPTPWRGALGGPTLTRSVAKGRSGAQRPPL